MSTLVLELFSEEIPAFMQKKAEEAYQDIFTRHLRENNIAFESLQVFSGARRITLHAAGLPKFIAAKEMELKGPKVGSPLPAVEGFCRANNIEVSQLSQKTIKDQLFYIYVQQTQEISVHSLLAEILPVAINDYIWSKSMYWGDYDIKWVRPLKNILCLLDDKILPIKFGHLTANNITYGHRFMSQGEIIIKDWQDYVDKLEHNYVILDRKRRQNLIEQQLQQLATQHNLAIKQDEKLLEEVAGLVEYPNAMIGKIDKKFLELPSEVLVTSMRTHQRYFSVYDNHGNFAPYFLFVSNIISPSPETVVHGNEKVLSARLSDALYFYNQDLAKTLESRLTKLEQIVFHAKLGSVKTKTVRLVAICQLLAPDNQSLQLAAKLCKGDLVAEMVSEFPELQGIMGYYYAKHEGLREEVAAAIRDHYKPAGLSDTLPQDTAAMLALADKFDSLVGLILAGERATSSKDPYALRRLALSIIRIILTNKLKIDLDKIIKFVVNSIKESLSVPAIQKHDKIEPLDKQDFSTDFKAANNFILSFLEERVKFYFKDQGYDNSLINATLNFNISSNLVLIEQNLFNLQNFLATYEGQGVLNAYKRVSNILNTIIVPKGEYQTNIKEMTNLYKNESYTEELYTSLTLTNQQVEQAISKQDIERALQELIALTKPIADFFDNVMVKDENPAIANNRALLLKEVKYLFLKVANFDFL